jgi:hypothetical protein
MGCTAKSDRLQKSVPGPRVSGGLGKLMYGWHGGCILFPRGRKMQFVPKVKL